MSDHQDLVPEDLRVEDAGVDEITYEDSMMDDHHHQVDDDGRREDSGDGRPGSTGGGDGGASGGGSGGAGSAGGVGGSQDDDMMNAALLSCELHCPRLNMYSLTGVLARLRRRLSFFRRDQFG